MLLSPSVYPSFHPGRQRSRETILLPVLSPTHGHGRCTHTHTHEHAHASWNVKMKMKMRGTQGPRSSGGSGVAERWCDGLPCSAQTRDRPIAHSESSCPWHTVHDALLNITAGAAREKESSLQSPRTRHFLAYVTYPMPRLPFHSASPCRFWAGRPHPHWHAAARPAAPLHALGQREDPSQMKIQQ